MNGNVFRNFKIINFIILLGGISLIISIGIGLSAYLNMKNLNQNIKELYSNQLSQVKIAGYIGGEMGQLRNALTKIIDRPYSEEYTDTVKKNDGLIRSNIEEIEKTNLSEEGKNLVGELKENYYSYMEGSKEIITKRKKGETIDAKFTQEYGAFGNKVSEVLTKLADSNVKSAQNMYISSNKEFENITFVFFIIVIGAILIILSIILLSYKIIKNSIKDFSNILNFISKGDFTVEIDKNSRNEFGIMKRELGKTVDSISNILKGFKDSTFKINEQTLSLSAISEEMSSSATQIGQAVQEVAIGSEGQTTELVNINGVINNFADSINNIVLVIGEVTDSASNINNMAEVSSNQLNQLVNSLSEIQNLFKMVSEKTQNLGTSISKITEITEIINNIADQTNLLALNAAIEAARAGEVGKGFAVVADEIRNLAEQSKNSSQNISNIVNVVSSESNEVIVNTLQASKSFEDQESIIQNSMGSFKEIIDAINKIIPLVNNVADLIKVIDDEKETIISKVENASAVSEENAAASEEIAASSDEMSKSAEEVASSSIILASVVNETMEQIEKFKV